MNLSTNFWGIDTRGQKILQDNGKTTVMWSAGANWWWVLDNNISLEETVAALRYTMPEMGGIIDLPTDTDAEVLKEYLDRPCSTGTMMITRLAPVVQPRDHQNHHQRLQRVLKQNLQRRYLT
eukprot:728697_1